VLKGLPVWLDSSSVRARLLPSGVAELVDVNLTREFLAEASDQDVRAAEKSLQEVTDQLLVLDDDLTVLAARRDQVVGISSFSMEKLPRDALTREIPVSYFQELVQYVNQELTTVAAQRREIERKRRDLLPQKRARELRLAELRQRAALEQCSISFTVQANNTQVVQLVVDYLLPGATWEPQHEVRFAPEVNQIQLATFAQVTQTTGEDWMGATIRLSTQSSTRTVSIPELETLLVGHGNTPNIFAADARDSFADANRLWIENRDEWNKAQLNMPAQQEEYQQNLAKQSAVQGRVAHQFERMQRRGTTALYEASSQQSIRSDGRPVRLPVWTMVMEGTPRIVAAPEISLNATRTARLQHLGDQPILPGRVALFQGGAFIGNTEVDFVASGEQFALFAGLVDDIKMTRRLDRSLSHLKRGRKTTKVVASFVVEVDNLSQQPVTIELADRIPVSDDKEIKVTGISISPEVSPSSDGLLLFHLDLAARSKKRLTISYTVEYPTDFNFAQTTETQQPKEKIMRQLMDLESLF